MPEVLDARLAAGDPPDVALLPQPGLLRRYADVRAARATRQGDDASSSSRTIRPSGSRSRRAGGRLYGVWFKAANKSLLWYDVAAFERAGIAPPDDLSGLLATARTLQASGIAPFSVGGG